MAITISTNHFLFEDGCPTIRAYGYEASWLCSCVTENDGSHTFERELMIERLDIKRTWHWTKKHGRWTVMGNGDYVDGWVRGERPRSGCKPDSTSVRRGGAPVFFI